MLQQTWNAQNYSVVPFDERSKSKYVAVDDGTSFPKIGESFYQVIAKECSDVSNADQFFKGGEPTWGDVACRIAPPRDAYLTLLEGLFEELLDVSVSGSAFIITGSAATGKTTLIRSLAYELATDTQSPVLIHIPGTPLDTHCLKLLADAEAPKRIVVCIHHASECLHQLDNFIADIKRFKLPVSLVLEERTNHWNTALVNSRLSFSVSEIELGGLSDNEIAQILDALDKHHCLGKLTGAAYEQQVSHFEAVAQKDLLVALRELTTLSHFDDIIRGEYETIPSPVAKEAYVYVSALGQIGLPVRFETLQHLLKIQWADFSKQVLAPAEGVLLSLQDYGRSRHNAGFRVETRHPIIASIIFAAAAADDEAKFAIINRLIGELDPGFPEDRRLLEDMTRKKGLVGTLASPHMRRAIYDQLERRLPGNAYVLQHRSILERELGNAEKAISYARQALATDKRNPVFANTLGFALEFAARSAAPMQRDAMISEASKYFEDGIKIVRGAEYSYLGKAAIIRQRIERENNQTQRGLLNAELLSLLEEASEATRGSNVIAGELAKQYEYLGSKDEAIAILKKALKLKESDERIRNLLVRMISNQGKLDEALKIALEGEKHDPTAWRTQRSIARLKRSLSQPVAAITGYYEAASRHNQGDPDLVAEYGAFLFEHGDYSGAQAVFEKGRLLKMSSVEKNVVREFWPDADGKRRVFSGKVSKIVGSYGFIMAIPANFEAMYWRTTTKTASLLQGDSVSFVVGFSAQGARAESIRQV